MNKKHLLTTASIWIIIAAAVATFPINLGTAASIVNAPVQVVSSTGDGSTGFSSLALDSNSSPHISFVDNTNGDLKFASWNGTAWLVQIVDAGAGRVGPQMGEYCSLALDANNRAHISYEANGVLKYATWTGSNWMIQTVDIGGGYCSLALDASGNPHISHCRLGQTGYYLRYASLTGSEWTKETADSERHVGGFTSLALDALGNPRIAYMDEYNADLKYAFWSGFNWTVQTIDSEGDVGIQPSLAIDSKGNSHISYYGGGLKYAVWNGSGWDFQMIVRTIPYGYSVGLSSSLKLDKDDYAHIAYYDASAANLRLTVQKGSSWVITTPDQSYNAGWSTSLILDANNNTHISYFDRGNYFLRYILLDKLDNLLTPPASALSYLPSPSPPSPPPSSSSSSTSSQSQASSQPPSKSFSAPPAGYAVPNSTITPEVPEAQPEQSEPEIQQLSSVDTPTMYILATSAVAVVAIGAGLAIYFNKRKH